MRKLLIVANYAKEHINKFHISTIKKFKDMGWQVDVACKADAEVPFCDHLYGLPCERNPFRFKTFKCIRELKKIIKENQYDVVNVHTLCGTIMGVLAAKSFRKKGLKVIITSHGFNYFKGSSLITKTLIPVDIYLTHHSDLVISDNKEDIDYGRSLHLKMDNAVYCPPPVNAYKFIPIDEHKAKRETIREGLGVSPDTVLLTYVAELITNKNQIYLLEVMKLLKDRGRNVKLMLVGPEHDDGFTERKAKELGLADDVLLMGWRNDIADLLCASDIYVASSIREGFGVNIIEAMLCELPVVASNNRGHRESVIDGENGFLVELNEPEKFAGRVEEIMNDNALRERFVAEGKKTYDRMFAVPAEEVLYNECKKMLGIEE